MNKTLLASLIIAALAAAPAADAVEVRLVINDPPGSGLNDPTPATPIGNNPGTTIGEQRRIAYQYAADLWGSILEGDVPVEVRAQFTALNCTATGGVLGSAGTTTVHGDFEGAPVPGTWYNAALANQLAGEDLNGPDQVEINSNFNANLGSEGCLENSGWYYGLDGNAPANRIDFLNVVVHEIGHGLGFQSFSNVSTGALFQGFPDMYNRNVIDGNSGLRWIEMTNAQRQAAAIGNALAWEGTAVNTEAQLILAPKVELRFTAPAELVGPLPIGAAAFGPEPTAENFAGNIVPGLSSTGVAEEGCGPFSNAAAVAGNIALVNRGTCPFTEKALNAQAAGATGLLVANNAPDAAPPGLGGADANVVIPAAGITQAAGAQIRANLPVTVAFVVDEDELAGTDSAGRVKTYAPATLAPGSSFSHFDTSLNPNAVMEPSITQTLQAWINVDLTPALYEDIGWTRNADTFRLAGCDTGLPMVEEGGIAAGAAMQANYQLCRNTSADSSRFINCVGQAIARVNASGFVDSQQQRRLARCNSRARLLIDFRSNP